MAVNAFISFLDKAEGESLVKGKEKWIEITNWSWDVDADTSWIKGSGASVGKPTPGKFNFEHSYDLASHMFLGYIANGRAFPKAELQMQKLTSKGAPETYFTMTMESCFITKVSNTGTEEGTIAQTIELVFKSVKIEYKPQTSQGTLGSVRTFNWDIPAGTASPTA